MKLPRLVSGLWAGLLLTLPLMAIMYAAAALTNLPFVPFTLFDWVTRTLPGPLVTFGIDRMIDMMLFLNVDVALAAKSAEQASAILQFLSIGVIAAAVYFVVISLRGGKADNLSGLILGTLVGLPLIIISLTISPPDVPLFVILWLALLFLGWGWLVRWAYVRTSPVSVKGSGAAADIRAVEKLSRRQFLIRLGATSAVVTVVGTGLGAVLAAQERRRQEEILQDSDAHDAEGSPRAVFPNADDPVMPVPGTRPEYTPVKDHYKVFLRTEPTVIDAASWTLPIMGMVDNPLNLTLDDIRNNFESRDQYVTLSCISGRIGTTLISTTQWTGVSVQDVLREAGIQSDARYLHITSGDGFYETVDLDLINSDERIMFCYAWDGNTLPIDHGFPLRIWIPDRYGMKQPKWITAIEVTDEYTDGYWVERNWDKVARVKATSVIDTVAVDSLVEHGGKMFVPVGGIAFAGARGISKVQVRVDGGAWEDAQLRSPLSETTWVIWRYEWPFEEGDHTFEVRCAEGDGTPQIEEAKGNRPDGASGIHSVEEEITA